MASNPYKGTNWGQIVLGEESIQFNTEGQQKKQIFQIKPSTISHISNTAKDIIFHLKDQVLDEGQELAQVRFHYQQKDEPVDDEEESGKKSDGSVSKQRVKTICEKIKKDYLKDKMDADSISTFTQVSLSVPRGKYSVDFFANMARFHGKTFSFGFKYSDITKSFILPTQNQSTVNLVLKFRGDRPVCQGQTTYNAIIIQFNAMEKTEIDVKLSQKVTAKYPHCQKLKKKYEGRTLQIFSDMLKIIAQITFIAPNPQQFLSKNKKTYVKCGIKAQLGWLYFLKKSILFIPKPITLIKLQQIIKVSFNRVGMNNKQFDIIVKLNGEKKRSVQFLGFDHQQLQGISAYFSKRGVKVEQEEQKKSNKKADVEDQYEQDDESDGDFEIAEDEEDDDEGSDGFEQDQQQERPSKQKKMTEKKIKKMKQK